MYTVLFTGNSLSDSEIDMLRLEGLQIEPAPIDYSKEQLIDALQDVDAYILGGEEIASEEVINAASENLKVISFYGAGHERYVDTEAATRKGIAVTNTPAANAHTVAEFTVGLVLDSVKQLTYLSNRTKAGIYERRQAWNLQDRVVGIVGMGAIGTRVARILHNGFGMRILYVSRNRKPEVEEELQAQKVTLAELLADSHVVSLHTSTTNETIGMIGANELEMMKEEAVLINSARAEIVDGHALYEALVSGKIATAAFDCYYIEPVPSPEDDEYKLMLLADNQFLLTPHTSYNSRDALKAMERMAVQSVIDVLNGRVPEHIVNPDYIKYPKG